MYNYALLKITSTVNIRSCKIEISKIRISGHKIEISNNLKQISSQTIEIGQICCQHHHPN